jgi:hypothetical protein
MGDIILGNWLKGMMGIIDEETVNEWGGLCPT